MRPFFVVSMLLLVAAGFIFALLPEASHAGGDPGERLVFGIACSSFVFGSVWLARREPYVLAGTFVLLATIALAGAGLALAVNPTAGAGVVVLIAIAVAVLVAGVAYIAAQHLGADRVPDVLAQRFGRRAMFEVSGVQVTACAPAQIRSDEIAPVDFYLQNCFDQPRTVEVAFDDTPLFGSGGMVRWNHPGQIVLAGSEVKHVRFPICATAPSAGESSVYVAMRVSGRGGKRLRRWRAPFAAPPLSRWLIALLVLLAAPVGFVVIVWGRGGLRFRVRRVPAGPPRTDALPEPETEVVWSAGAS
jgi:hypothetical protein